MTTQRSSGWRCGSLITALAFAAAQATALPLTPDEFGYNLTGGTGAVPSVASYYNLTDTYTSTSTMTSGTIWIPATGPLVGDIVGVSLISADIDSTGDLKSGTFAWIGSSESLNIATGTTLISATLTDVYYDTSIPERMQFRARVDFVSPALRVATGPIKSMLIYDWVNVLQDFSNNPWNADFLSDSATESPSLWLSPEVLPLTFDELLANISAFSPNRPLSAYDHTTDIYTMSADFGTHVTAAWVRNYPDNSVLINDITGELDLLAVVDSTGSVQSGSFVWTGGSFGLGIPLGTVLIGGTPVEAHYSSSPAMVQFLVLVENVDPQIESIIGPVETLVVYDPEALGPGFTWDSSFSDADYAFGPGLYMTPETMMNADTDGDGIADRSDNCVAFSNGDQRDVDGDGIGSRCDVDLSQDCVVNAIDLGALKSVFFSSDANADFNGDGSVNAVDLGIMKESYFANFMLDNPSALQDVCDGG